MPLVIQQQFVTRIDVPIVHYAVESAAVDSSAAVSPLLILMMVVQHHQIMSPPT